MLCPSFPPACLNVRCPLTPDIVAKVFLGWRTKILRAADAFSARRREGPYRFSEKRPPSFVVAPRSVAGAKLAKNQSLRDFRRRSIFDFCNKVCQKLTSGYWLNR